MSIRPCHQIIDFISCLPCIGIPAIVGQACVIEKAASTILKGEDVDGKPMSQDHKARILF